MASESKKCGRNLDKCKLYATRHYADYNAKLRAARHAKRQAQFAARRARLGPAKLRKGCFMCNRSVRADRQHSRTL